MIKFSKYYWKIKQNKAEKYSRKSTNTTKRTNKNIYENNIERELKQNIFNSFSGHLHRKIEDEITNARMPLTKLNR